MLEIHRLNGVDQNIMVDIRERAESYSDYEKGKNAVHFLAVEKHDLPTTTLSTLYRLWFVESARVRALLPHKIRWLRADWYGVASDPYTTSFKKFAQASNPDKFDSRKDSQKMSIALSQLVQSRVVDYKDLSLQDNTRQRLENSVKGWNGIILGIEKNAMWTDELQSFCNNLGILVVTSGSGEPSRNSNEMVWDIVDRARVEKPVLLCVTDYDKYGFYIANTFREHLETYGQYFAFKRVGIDFEDLSPEEATPESSLYELPNSWDNSIRIAGDHREFGIEMDVKEWKFYFRKIMDALLELGYTIEDFDQWAREYKSAREYRAIEDAVDTIVEDIDFYKIWEQEIERLEALKEKTREKIKEQLEPQSEPIQEDPDFDDREDQTDKFIEDLVALRQYEDRYNASYLTDKLQTGLEEWFETEGEVPEENDIVNAVDNGE